MYFILTQCTLSFFDHSFDEKHMISHDAVSHYPHEFNRCHHDLNII